MKVYQLVISNSIPSEIQVCIDSVKRWCDKQRYEYVQVNQLPEEIIKKYGSVNIRNLSDFWKISILSSGPYSLVLDYDILIDKSFCIKGSEFKINNHGDILLYNGNKTKVFKVLQQDMIEHFVSENEQGQLFKSWNRCIKNGSVKVSPDNFINEGYTHLNWSKKK